MKKVYIVATVRRFNGDDLFADVILVTPGEDEARTIKKIVKERRPYPGLDYSLLAAFDDVLYFERELGSVVQNKEESYECHGKEAYSTGGQDH